MHFYCIQLIRYAESSYGIVSPPADLNLQ